jgi:hypothetical protein
MKHKPKALLLIAGVAIMLAAATSASAYLEYWEGWFNSGYLVYDDYTFNYTEGESTLEDHTVGDVDEFSVSSITSSTFTCSTGGGYYNYSIKVWSDPSGWKDTGRSGQKEAEGDPTPTWTGTAKLYNDEHVLQDTYTIGGTWNTGNEYDDMYFDYDPETPTYSAHWILSGSSPPDITEGEGDSEGEQTYYEDLLT